MASLTQPACKPGEGGASRSLTVARAARAVPPAPAPEDPLWRAGSVWSHHLEQVYSAWIEALFDAPDDEMPSWGALHEVLRDRKRNFLFDHLGRGEDDVNAPPCFAPTAPTSPTSSARTLPSSSGSPSRSGTAIRAAEVFPPRATRRW